jgi:dihydroorotate dehydrogenase electron transfer subunit
MTNPLGAKYYADHSCQREVTIVENVRLARETFRVRFAAPEIASRILPGQFLMLRLVGWNDPLIGRPLAMYDVQDEFLDVVYLVKGKFTTRLAELPAGAPLQVWGPLGNGFSAQPVEHLVMVAGGIGQTPFLALGKQFLGRQSFGQTGREAARAQKVTLLYGARTADYLAGVEQFRSIGIDLRIATDDGSAGEQGLVTKLLRDLLSSEKGAGIRVACCGPEPMMESVANIAAEHQVACEVSLETPMACGIGICFTCVAKVRDEAGAWDYKRTCVDGPVFDACAIAW